MLSIILVILKIVGIILLSVFLLLLLLLAVVLFVGFRYNVEADKGDALSADVRISWLFRIFRARIIIEDGEQKISFKALWFDLLGKNKRKERRSHHSAVSLEKEVMLDEYGKDDFMEEEVNRKAKTGKGRPPKPKKVKKERESFFEKIGGIKDKINYVLKHPDRKKIQAYTIELLKDEAKAIKPKRFALSGTIGFDDPSVTGKVIGLVCAGQGLCPYHPDWARVTIRGNFERAMLDASLRIKGTLSIWAVLFPFIKYVFKKPIWAIVKPKLFGKGERNGSSVKQQS